MSNLLLVKELFKDKLMLLPKRVILPFNEADKIYSVLDLVGMVSQERQLHLRM